MPDKTNRSGSETIGDLWSRIGEWPVISDKERAQIAFAQLQERAQGIDGLFESLASQPVANLLRGIFSSSPYLSALIQRDPARLARLLHNAPEQYFSQLLNGLSRDAAAAASISEVMSVLRAFKNEVALLIALCDLGAVWPVLQTTQYLTQAADAALRASVCYLFDASAKKGDWLAGKRGEQSVPVGAITSGYFVLAMGKQGAHELNYSSDIDLIVLYDRARAAGRTHERLDEKTFFVRLTRDLVKLMQERTGDGYVFRTDLRLRPDPGATQAAMSTDAALEYYESFGQNWERAALIKARVVAGDIAAGEAFLNELSPFIWRKYLDYAAIHDIHAMKRKIHSFKGFGEIGVAGHNIKLGRGGIREIEFFVQSQQLIAGGRQADLRLRPTVQALEKLQSRGWIERQVREDLTGAYLFLRKVEHRLQMIADEQTQTLPNDAHDVRQIALFSGFGTVDAFSKTLVQHMSAVQRHYGALFEADDEAEGAAGTGTPLVFSGEDNDPDTLMALRAMGYQNPPRVIDIIRGWQRGQYAAMRSERARELLTQMQPDLLTALSRTSEPDAAILAFDKCLERLPTGVQLFALLQANPALMRLVADIMGSAPRLARILSRRHRVLDAVLDPGFFGSIPSKADLARMVNEGLSRASDYEDALNRARVIGNEQSFLIGVRVLSRTIGAGRAGGAYAQLAQSLIDGLQSWVASELSGAHGAVAGGGAVVVAMGKLGGWEMTAASDLDVILIYDYDRTVLQSDGRRPISATQYYTRYTQRLIAALSAPTAEGTIYEVDLRLRPSGQKGPVATKLASFIDYQAREAWTWEHMALTRARVVSGPPPLRRQVEEAIRNVLTAPRDRANTANDVREMRARIEAEKGTSDIWNLKQIRGGILDLEFIVQYLQLIHAPNNPQVLDQNTYRAVGKLEQAGLLQADRAARLIDAANLYNNLTQVLRLCLDEAFLPERAPEGMKDLLCRAGEMPDFERLEATLRATLAEVRQEFDNLII